MKESIKESKIVVYDDRFYQIKGVPYPRCTWILDVGYAKGKEFFKWLGNSQSFAVAEEQKEEAGSKGTRLHHAAQRLISGKELKYEEFELGEWEALTAFVQAIKDNNIKFLEVEKVVYSKKKNRFAGRFDYLCSIDNQKIILDLKTSKSGIYNSYFAQVAAYATAFEEMGLGKIAKTGILRIGTLHAKKYELKFSKDWKTDFKLFAASYEIWKKEYPSQKPNNKEIVTKLKL